MRTLALNKLSAKSAKNAGDGLHSDGGGLFLQVRGNSRSWMFRFTEAGKKKSMGLGPVTSVTLAKAREQATKARETLAMGGDPRGVKAAVVPAPAPIKPSVITFGEALKRHVVVNKPTWSNGKHTAQWSATVENYAASLMKMPVDQITVTDVEAVLKDFWLIKPETARRTRGRIERVLGGCIARREMSGPNPAAMKDNLEHILPSQKNVAKVKHHAAIPVDDAPSGFAKLWAKRGEGQGYAALITVALTAMRSGEVRHMQWGDLHDDVISIPAERMKARRAHIIPVTPVLGTWLGSQERWAGTALIFPGQKSNRAMSDMTMAMAMRRSGMGEFTVHGWRSTFRDWAAGNEWARELAEYQLAHAVGNEVERAYARDTLVERRRSMMEAWEAYVCGVIND